MQLITSAQRQKLLENRRGQLAAIDRQDLVIDFEPVVKLFTPDGNATWLLTELNPDIDLAFGLCDLGLGQPEIGYVSLLELAAVRGPLGLPLERDLHFAPLFQPRASGSAALPLPGVFFERVRENRSPSKPSER
jgi:Protein of unknown function (DUF2958)